MNTFSIYHLIIRVPKEQSAFVYFTLEASEGLGFYSTLDHVEGQTWRDIDIKGPMEFYSEIKRLITKLSESIPTQIITQNPI